MTRKPIVEKELTELSWGFKNYQGASRRHGYGAEALRDTLGFDLRPLERKYRLERKLKLHRRQLRMCKIFLAILWAAGAVTIYYLNRNI